MEARTEGYVYAHFDLVLSIELVVVQSIFCNGSTRLVHELHERDVLLCRDKTDLVEARVSIA